jgi:hypothetical protein
MGLKATPLEANASQSKPMAALSFSDDLTQSLLNQRVQSRLLTIGETSSLLKNTVRDMYERFHMPNHTAEHRSLAIWL